MKRAALVTAGIAVGGFAYSAGIERNLFTLREFTVPVLTPGSAPVRVLHVSDLHLTARQQRKQAWVRDLARLQPDLVINTGDTSSHPLGIPAIMRTLEPLFEFPGAFVPGNNDYYIPTPRSPFGYFKSDHDRT